MLLPGRNGKVSLDLIQKPKDPQQICADYIDTIVHFFLKA